jgi:Spy/CpxP family protein refolding chaperone
MAAAGRKFAMRDRPRALAVLISVFLLGCLAGSTGSYFWLKKSPDLSRRSPDYRDGAMKDGPMPRPQPPDFKQILQLTPEQDVQFKETVAEYRRRMTEFRKNADAFHFEQDAKIQGILSEMDRKIYSILNDEQKKKFASWKKEFENTRRRPQRRRDLPAPPPQ